MIIVVMPSRGRPQRCREAVDAIFKTAELVTTFVTVAVDEDDPTLEGYQAALHRSGATLETLRSSQTGDLVRATNAVAVPLATSFPDAIIANFGDDHMSRTLGWDSLVEEALKEPGIAYGDDLLQRQRLPTAPFISAKIVNALGWYALPCLRHMYIDNVWKDLGESLGRLVYLPAVVTEHMHPGAGKAPNDEGYDRADALTQEDRVAYEAWLRTMRDDDVETMRRGLA